jgi:hypothetical protein
MNATLKFLLAIALALPVFCGCDGGGDGNSDPTVDVTGTWRGTSTFTGSSESETIRLTQNGGNVTGTDDSGINYSGSVSGKKLNLIASASNGADILSVDVSGNVEGDSMVLSGTMRGTVGGTKIDGPITFNLHR